MGSKEKTLDADNIKTIRQFEFELSNVGERNGCTTVDNYTITYKKETTKVEDGGCAWNGDYYLKQNLFGKQ
jgi:hypothetical protein